MLGIVAALLFALPGAFGVGGGLSPVFAARDGDVCTLIPNVAPTVVGGQSRYQVKVGDTFDVLARVQDDFEAKFRIDFDGGDEGPGQVDAIPLLESLVNIGSLVFEVDSEVGEAKITDRIEDDEDTVLNWIDWDDAQDTDGGPDGADTEDAGGPIEFGEAERNIIPGIDVAHQVDILSAFASNGDDDDAPGDVDSDDIRNLFVERGKTAADRTFAEGALTDCGSPLLTVDGYGSTAFGPGDQAAIFFLMVSCENGLFRRPRGTRRTTTTAKPSTTGSSTAPTASTTSQVSFSLDGWSSVSITCTKPGEVRDQC